MQFRFLHELTIGDRHIADITGHLQVERDDTADPLNTEPTWRIADVVLDTTEAIRPARPSGNPLFRDVETSLPADHPLYAMIVPALLNTHRHAIDQAWAGEVAEQAVLARSRFTGRVRLPLAACNEA